MLREIFNWEKINDVCGKICYFVLMNFIFFLFNLPLLLFFLFVGISQVRTCLPLFFLCLLPLPPSLSAVFYGMNRLVGGTEQGALKDFIKSYKADTLQKWKLSGGQMFLLFVFWTNVEFFAKQIFILPLVILFFLLFLYTILITPYLYLLASRYQMDTKSLIKSACILTVTRPAGTLGNLAAIGIILMATELCAGTTMLFAASMYGFLVVFMNKGLLKKLEE